MSSSQHQQHLPLAGKTAIITGASRGTSLSPLLQQLAANYSYPAGIGAAIAHKFAVLGIANLVLTYTSSSSAEAIEGLSQHLRSEFHPRLKHVAVIKADMGTLEGPLKVITEARHLLGVGEALTVNILVNNAGVAGNWRLVEGPKIKEFEWMYK